MGDKKLSVIIRSKTIVQCNIPIDPSKYVSDMYDVCRYYAPLEDREEGIGI